MEKKKALIAMSGGVDSSVSAYLMQEAGFACEGAIMRLHDYKASDDVEDARRVAGKLSMPFHVIDAEKEFDEKVIRNFVSCYECGATPNP